MYFAVVCGACPFHPRLPQSYHAQLPETSDLRSQTGLFEGWLSFY